jgi:hypothetical protein
VRLVVGVSVLATATACGEKKVDPYANSLAQGSEHVEFHGTAGGHRLSGYGDFRGERGNLVTHAGAVTIHEVVVGHRSYVKTAAGWKSTVTTGPNTPAELFRKRLPATVEGGLVRRMVVGPMTYEFSRYGEQVSVTVPRVKGSK